ncbi:MAG: hypothetical protein ACRD16_15400 [Thermoanaerobaculia bacterium]
MKECPFCLRPIGNDVVECPHCKNQVDIFRTGFYTRADLSKPKTATIWVVAGLAVALLAFALSRACARARPAARSDAPAAAR